MNEFSDQTSQDESSAEEDQDQQDESSDEEDQDQQDESSDVDSDRTLLLDNSPSGCYSSQIHKIRSGLWNPKAQSIFLNRGNDLSKI